jgi:hypothetical protein
VLVVVVVVVLVVVAVAAGVLFARRGAAAARERVDQRLAGLDVLRRSKANLFGVASEGAGQVRGVGVLVLTPDELVFVQFVPDREVRISRRQVTSATTSRSFLGKSQGRDLLIVTWSTDVAAWDVPDIAGWQAALSPR